jgi:AAA15 family ATPase/GTPase
MIDRIYAKNYRAFKELDVPLSKINLFFGPNNSGKSSIMSLINLLSQTLLSSDDTVRLLLRGSKEDLGTYRDVIYKNEIKNPLIIGIESRPTLRRSYQLGFRKDIQKLKGSIELEYNYKSRRHEVVLKHINTDIPEAGIRIQIKKTKTGNNSIY